jgi:hypothetical protein
VLSNGFRLEKTLKDEKLLLLRKVTGLWFRSGTNRFITPVHEGLSFITVLCLSVANHSLTTFLPDPKCVYVFTMNMQYLTC